MLNYDPLPGDRFVTGDTRETRVFRKLKGLVNRRDKLVLTNKNLLPTAKSLGCALAQLLYGLRKLKSLDMIIIQSEQKQDVITKTAKLANAPKTWSNQRHNTAIFEIVKYMREHKGVINTGSKAGRSKDTWYFMNKLDITSNGVLGAYSRMRTCGIAIQKGDKLSLTSAYMSNNWHTALSEQTKCPKPPTTIKTSPAPAQAAATAPKSAEVVPSAAVYIQGDINPDIHASVLEELLTAQEALKTLQAKGIEFLQGADQKIKDLQAIISTLKSENERLTANLEQVNSNLNVYLVAEHEAKALQRQEALDKIAGMEEIREKNREELEQQAAHLHVLQSSVQGSF